MKGIPDKSVDLVLTDPPYNASNSNIGFKNGYKTINETWDKDFNPLEFMMEADRIIKEGGSIIAFCSYHTLGCYLNIKHLNFRVKIQQILHWEHVTALPAIAKVYTPVIEYAVWFSTPKYIFNKKYAERNVLRFKKSYQVEGKLPHPSVKPISLIKKLLDVHSNQESIVLDPFLGSGTTAVACKELGRKFIGIEKEQKYCDIANRRLAQEYLF
jgi:DNA modification methylase